MKVKSGMGKMKLYVAPQTRHMEVELENGFLKASIFEEGEGHDKGVSISGHGFGNTGNYFDNNIAGQGDQPGWNDWDN